MSESKRKYRAMIKSKNVDYRKASIMSIIANALQIVLSILLVVLVLSSSMDEAFPMLRPLAIGSALVVILGAAMDIAQSVTTMYAMSQLDTLEDTLDTVTELNTTLRAQRHDFLNHLQVVYSLIELKEYEEANRYIETLYGDITAVGRNMRTADAAVNALLELKQASCEKVGVTMEVEIRSAWKDLPVPGWEMCKVLSNLIDNAVDAMQDTPEPQLRITLTEDIRSFRFRVANCGPEIPPQLRESIFRPGISTKGENRGMGLYIVQKTLHDFGGEISLTCEDGWTSFDGYIPKAIAGNEKA